MKGGIYMKKYKLPIIISLIVIVIIVFTYIIALKNNDIKTKNDELLASINKLLKNDYLISNAVVGSSFIDEANVVIDNTKYNIVINKNLTTIADLQNLIFDTYTGNALDEYLLNIDKYNKYVEIENDLYVNVNSLCTVSNFDKNIEIIKDTSNQIVVKNNNKEIIISKKDGKYKLKDSAYQCE